MRVFMIAVAAVSLAACEPSVPDSAAGVVNPGRGVGFGDYDAYERAREEALTGRPAAPVTVTGPVDVQATPLDSAGDPLDGQATATAAAANSGITPLDASPSNPPPRVVTNAAGISGENDFDAVSNQRDIQADATLIARNRAQYEVISPTDVPDRPGTNRPNIVEYALQTTNPVGSTLYSRSRFGSDARHQRACAGYASPDLAQEDFLAQGGPQKDRKGLDPDGDGFACTWSPAPFRAVRGG